VGEIVVYRNDSVLEGKTVNDFFNIVDVYDMNKLNSFYGNNGFEGLDRKLLPFFNLERHVLDGEVHANNSNVSVE
jgi:hypothetical protein